MENVRTAARPRFTSAKILFTIHSWSGPNQGQMSSQSNAICAWDVELWKYIRQRCHQVCLARVRHLWMKYRKAIIGRKWHNYQELMKNGLGCNVHETVSYLMRLILDWVLTDHQVSHHLAFSFDWNQPASLKFIFTL